AAREACDIALGIDPRSARALHLRARIAIECHHDLEGAIADLGRAIASVPSSAPIWADRARARLDMYDVAEIPAAREDVDPAGAIGRGDASALSARARVLFEQNLHDEALRVFGAALEVDPRFAEALAYRSIILRVLGKDAKRSAADAELAVEVAPRLSI